MTANGLSFRVGAGAVVCALTATAGCAGGDGDVSPVLRGLAAVRFEERPPEVVTVVDAARLQELVAADERKFELVDELGTTLPTPHDLPQHGLGMDPADAELAVTVGPRDLYGFWMGEFDVKGVESDLKAAGFAPYSGGIGSNTTWAGDSRRVAVGEGRIAWATDGAPDVPEEDEGKVLVDEPRYQAMRECLGDVYRADFTERGKGGRVTAWAVGQAAVSAGETSEVLCAVTDTEASARAVADEMRQWTRDRDVYRGSEVGLMEGDRPGVRLTQPHDSPELRPGGLLGRYDPRVRALAGQVY